MKRANFARMGGAAAFAILMIGVLVFGVSGSAQAHNYLVSSNPSAGQVLTALPTTFSVTTNDLLLNLDKSNGFALQVTDASGRFYGDGCVTIAGDTVSTTASLGTAGDYTLTWQVVSTDGHPVSNTVAFVWQPPASFTAAAGSATVPNCHGTLTANSSGGVATSTKSVVESGVLSTVLWVGGSILVIGIAVILTIVIASRRKK